MPAATQYVPIPDVRDVVSLAHLTFGAQTLGEVDGLIDTEDYATYLGWDTDRINDALDTLSADVARHGHQVPLGPLL